MGNFKVCLSTETDIHIDTRKTNLESFPETRKNILEKQGQRELIKERCVAFLFHII